jgi:putative ABC transport system permease protein
MNGIMQDIRYALRQMVKNPGFAASAMIVLALGIGATTGMLGVVQSVLVRPLHYQNPEQLVLLGATREANSTSNIKVNVLHEMQQGLRSFAELGAYSNMPMAVQASGGAEMVMVPAVTTDFFKMLGVQPVMGRTFREGDDAPGANITIVSQQFWKNSMNGRKDVLGSKIKIAGDFYTVVGVMPQGFQFPLQTQSLWTALQLTPDGKTKQGIDELSVLGRLKPGVTLEQARSEGEAFLRNNPAGISNGQLGVSDGQPNHFWIYPYQALVTGNERPAILALLAACVLLLLIAVVNTANLQIARATKREAEIAMRSALGATRARLLRQLITESLLLCLGGAAVGWLLAVGFVHAARHLFAAYARFDEIKLDFWTFTACLLLTSLCGVAAALAPARHLLKRRGDAAFQGRTSGRASRPQRLSGSLVAAEVALTCILLIAAGLFLKTFRSLQQVPLGFDSGHVTSFVLWPQDGEVPFTTTISEYQRILDRLNHLPDVETAGMVTSLPISNFQISLTGNFTIPGYVTGQGKDAPEVRLLAASQDYFRALRIPLLAGRGISEGDAQGAPLVGVVNRVFAEKILHGVDPIGKQIVLDKDAGLPPITIVGVSGDVVQGNAIGGTIAPEVLVPFQQIPPSGMLTHFMVGLAASFAVKTKSNADANQDIRAIVKTEAPQFAVDGVAPLDEAVQKQLAIRRLTVEITSAFAWVALLLSAAGLYGVLAYLVGQRVREIGIRLALGATRENVFVLVARQGLLMVGAGLIIGWVVALAAGRWIQAFLFQTTTHDFLTYALVGAVIVFASVLAISLPARRAAKVDPMVALRYE